MNFKIEKRYYLLTSFSLILIAILVGIAYVYIHLKIYIPGNEYLTYKLLIKNIFLFKIEIILWVFIFVLEIIVSISLYEIYKVNKKHIIILSSFLRILYTLFLGISILSLSTSLSSYDEVKNILKSFEYFEYIWNMGLIIFGLHLIFLSISAFNSNFTPKIISLLLFLGGLSYVILHTLKTFFISLLGFTFRLESILIIPMIVCEIIFAFWFVYKYYKIKKMEKRMNLLNKVKGVNDSFY